MAQPPKGYFGAYSSNQRGVETGRDVDAHALLRCASRLELARDPACDKQEYVEAIRHNQRLWTVFQVCLTDPDNALPREIKLSLFKLSRYVDKVSFSCVAKRDPEGIASLININRQIAAGLSTRPEQAASATTSPYAQQAPAPSPTTPPEDTKPVMTMA